MISEAPRLRVAVDAQRCMGSGNCAYWAPQVFDLGDDQVALLVGDPDEHRDRVRLAAEHCPTHAISLALADGSEPAERHR